MSQLHLDLILSHSPWSSYGYSLSSMIMGLLMLLIIIYYIIRAVGGVPTTVGYPLVTWIFLVAIAVYWGAIALYPNNK